MPAIDRSLSDCRYELIRALGAHLVERYGLEEVATWHFEVLREPSFEFISY